MRPQTTMSSGSRFPGRGAAGRENSPLLKAVHTKYTAARRSGASGTPIYVNGPCGRQCAGYVVSEGGRRMLRKTKVRRAVHYCRKHGGYGVELEALRQSYKLGVQAVRLVFDDSNRVLEASLAAFADRGVPDKLGGFGEQVFLPLRYWRDLNDPQQTLGFDQEGLL